MPNPEIVNDVKSRSVASKGESPQLFESKSLEFLSKVHPATPLVVFLPVIAGLVYFAIVHRGVSIIATTGWFALGVLIWTLVEYLMHRYLFHYEARSRLGQRIHFLVHGAHHDYPQDASRLVAPPAFSIPVAAVFYGLFFLIFGRATPAPFAGFLFGYLCYDMIHYATHHFSMKRGVGLWLKQYHMRHHYKDDHHGFGVSSPLWDYVFGTRGRRRERSRNFVSAPNH